MGILQGRLFGIIMWKNFLLMSEKRLTLLALLAMSVLTAGLLIVSRKQSVVTIVPKPVTFLPHSTGACEDADWLSMQDDAAVNASIKRYPSKAIWLDRCSFYMSYTGWRVWYTPDEEIIRTLMDNLKYDAGL